MKSNPNIIVVSLNPCMDKTVEVAGFAIEKTNRVSSSRTDIGGKGINVARVLRTTDANFVTTGLVAGTLGRKLVDCMEGMGIRTAFNEAEGETRTNLKIIDSITGTMTELNEKGFQAGSAFNDFRETLMLFLPNADVMVLSGSVPADLSNSVYRELVALGNTFGVKIILDADGPYLQKGLEAKPYAIKPNLAELETLVGHTLSSDEEIIAEARKIVASGVSLVVVSLGEAGAILVRNSMAIRTRPFPIEVGSAAAAGDSMVAMLSFGILNNWTLIEMAKAMTAAGTLTASLPGTQVTNFEDVMIHKDEILVEIHDQYSY